MPVSSVYFDWLAQSLVHSVNRHCKEGSSCDWSKSRVSWNMNTAYRDTNSPLQIHGSLTLTQGTRNSVWSYIPSPPVALSHRHKKTRAEQKTDRYSNTPLSAPLILNVIPHHRSGHREDKWLLCQEHGTGGEQGGKGIVMWADGTQDVQYVPNISTDSVDIFPDSIIIN